MKEYILQSLTDLSTLDLNTVLLNNAVSLVLCIFIMFTYYITYSGTAYSKKFNVSLGMIVLVTTLIMSIISNNIALSLGMVGALSIIRFRTAVKDVRDATFIFWGIAVGICCGVSQYVLSAVSSVVVFLFLLALRQVGPDGKLLLIVRSDIYSQNRVETAVGGYFGKHARQIMKNATAESCEIIYTLRQSVLAKAKLRNHVDIVEKLIKTDGVNSVNLVEQTDDIGR
ncbi:MAG: DUF4956 domain-containing protein [Clostridia bacterium]